MTFRKTDDEAVHEAYRIWKRGYLLDNEKVTFHTCHGKVTFKHDGESLSVTIQKELEANEND